MTDPDTRAAGSPPAGSAHSDAEQDPRGPSRAANQPRTEPVPPGPAHTDMPASGTDQPDAAGVPAQSPDSSATDPQAGVPERSVTDVTPAPGTSEEMAPIEGVHTPEVGPGGEQFDTAEPAVPNRTTDSR
ncbi:MAG: hypothetical protein M3042_13465 [Actinomycetota bacterium]|nr:hypothetical protein [Actinomycetota bacterium]